MNEESREPSAEQRAPSFRRVELVLDGSGT